MKDFEEVESYEQEIAEVQAGRKKVSDITPDRQKRLAAYIREKRAHGRAQREEYEREYAASWSAAFGPKVLVRRRERLGPSAFPPGTRIGDARALVEELRPEHEALKRECAELRSQLNQAQQTLDGFDVERASGAHEYVAAQSTVTFYAAKLRAVTQRAVPARQRFEYASEGLRSAYAEFCVLVDELNAIGDPHRPLAGDSIEQRAREAGEIARLEFLLDAMMKPRAAATGKQRAA